MAPHKKQQPPLPSAEVKTDRQSKGKGRENAVMEARKKQQPPPHSAEETACSSKEEKEGEHEAPSNEKVGPTSKAKEVSEEEEEEAEEESENEEDSEEDSEEEEAEEESENEEESEEEGGKNNDKNKASQPSPNPNPMSTATSNPPLPPSKKPTITTTLGDDIAKIRTPPPFQRIWPLEDELVVLKSLAEYKRVHGSVPSQNHLGAFRESIVDKLTVDITTPQIFYKLRVFKKKFETGVKKGKSGKEPHDRKVFQLSKKIWGREVVKELVRNVHGSVEEEEDDVMKEESIKREREYPFLKELAEKSGLAAVMALKVVEEEKKNKLEGKLKRQKLAEVKHDLQRMDLLRETAELIMDGIKRSS